jgi:hypothetical protein
MFVFPRPAGPAVNLYDGDLRFDGGRAFADLAALAGRFPSRHTGTEAYAGAVDWTVARLEALGLDPVVEEFTVWTKWPGQDAPGSPDADDEGTGLWDELLTPLSDLRAYETQGNNVTAVAPGRSAEVVVVFAHLDSVPGSPGAEDNASGVAVLLELARLLTAEKPRYTYAFVAFGGEEDGLWGSRAWIAEHVRGSDQGLTLGNVAYGPVRLAVGLDCVGYAEGHQPQMYSMALGGRQCDANTLALVAAAMESREPGWRRSYARLGAQLADSRGGMASDQLSFLHAGLSAICFGRRSDDGSDSPNINTSRDNLSGVSQETLLDAGRFAERFLRTLEAADLPPWPADRSSVLHPRGLTPGWMLAAAAGLLLAFLVAVGLLTPARDLAGTRTDRLRAEFGWYGLVVAWSAILAAAYNLIYVEGVPQVAVFLLWPAAAVGSLAALTWLRLKRFWPVADGVNDYLSLVLAAWGVAGWLLFGPARIVFVLFWPAVLLGRLRGRLSWIKAVCRVVLIAWVGVLILSALIEGAIAAQLGLGLPQLELGRLVETAGRAWFLGLGLALFPVVWQATAREPAAMAVLVSLPVGAASPDPQVRRALARQRGLRQLDQVYCGPEAELVEAATSLASGRPRVLEELRDWTAPEGTQAGLERLRAALDRIGLEVAAGHPRPASGPVLVVLPAGLSALRSHAPGGHGGRVRAQVALLSVLELGPPPAGSTARESGAAPAAPA